MRVFYGLETLPQLRRAVVTVGSYDGVHLGHQALISRMVAEARRRDGESVVVTFDPHPRIALGRGEGMRLLTTLEQKQQLFERLGVDNLLVLPFDGAFSALSGVEFVRNVLVGSLGAEALIAGYNHRFGHDRMVCAEHITELPLEVIIVDECQVDGAHVSSTVIRRLLDEERISEAEVLLGYPLHKL